MSGGWRKNKHVFRLTGTTRRDRRRKRGKSVKEIGKRNDLRRSTFSFTTEVRTMKNWGYARCSTNEDKQDIDRQIRELKAAGAEEIFIEYMYAFADGDKANVIIRANDIDKCVKVLGACACELRKF